MDLSVAMCTYNGAEYLYPQFKSILSQTHPPDEIVIFDDCSTDGTRELLSEYAEEYPELISLYLNDKNVGPDQNFERAIRTCSGDVIAVSDQDDIWKEKKLERQLEEFRRQDASLIFHNSTVASESLDPVSTLWNSLSHRYKPKNEDPDNQFRCLLRRNFVQGASMLFDSSLRKYCLPIPDSWFYDYWIATVAAYRGGIHGIDKTMLTYRQHENQVIGASADPILRQIKQSLDVGSERYRKNSNQWATLYNTIEQADDSEMVVEKEDALRAVESRIQYEESRRIIYSSKSVTATKHLMGNVRRGDYQKYGNGWKGALKDLGRVFIGLTAYP